MTAPPTIQTNPLDPVFSGVPVVISQGNLVNPTWNKWFVDLREKVNVINSTLAAWSGITPVTGLPPGTYGDTTHYPVVTVNEYGLITGIAEQAVSGGGGNPMKITTLTGDHTISPADAPATTANIGWLEQTANTSNIITIDTNANQNCPVGTHIFIRENTGGTTTINGVSGVTLSGPTITDGGNYSIGQVVQIALNSWAVFGNIPWANYVFTPATWDSGKLASNVTRTSGTVLTNNATGYNTCAGTLGKSSGKWIFITTCNGTNDYFSGIAAQQSGSSIPWINGRYLGYADLTHGESIGFENYNGQFHYSSQAAAISGSSSTSSGVGNNVPLTVAVDLDSSPQTIKMFNGNTLLNSFNIPIAMAGFTWYPATSILYSGNTVTLNAGQSTITIPTSLVGLGYNPYWGT